MQAIEQDLSVESTHTLFNSTFQDLDLSPLKLQCWTMIKAACWNRKNQLGGESYFRQSCQGPAGAAGRHLVSMCLYCSSEHKFNVECYQA